MEQQQIDQEMAARAHRACLAAMALLEEAEECLKGNMVAATRVCCMRYLVQLMAEELDELRTK